ncbi:MAG TPA: sulfocyanin-like copper-binding protein [Gemmatimonadales bacterium]|nr:sulfocyanin-like copper-binding protein [Gemmatimonadales bacterium]
MRALTKQGTRALAAAAGLCLLAAGAGAQGSAGKEAASAWLKTDSTAKTAEFTVIAGLTPLNAGMNFDGAKDGGLTLTVPEGWTVVLHVRNNDQMLPHSVEVIRDSQPIPVGPVTPAFAHAATSNLAGGLSAEAKQDVRFIAAQAGNYIIFCAVPGHGAAGMWVRLVVSPAAKGPTLVASAAKP